MFMTSIRIRIELDLDPFFNCGFRIRTRIKIKWILNTARNKPMYQCLLVIFLVLRTVCTVSEVVFLAEAEAEKTGGRVMTVV